MTKIAESKGKTGESFMRLFGNEALGLLLSKIQSTVIRSGFELEETIRQFISPEKWTTLTQLADVTENPSEKPPIQIVFKPTRPDPDLASKSIQADYLIVDNRLRRFMLVEVKEGSVFDTKKSDGELESLRNITSWLAQEFAYRTHYYICAFNEETKEAIVAGTKRRFSIDHVMTGRELCEIIGIDYDTLREYRKRNQRENLEYFLEHLLKIPEVRTIIVELLSEQS